MRDSIKSLLFIVACAATTYCEANPRQQQPPNVVLILADDLTMGDLGHRNGGLSRTPHLDRLARQSVTFRSAYSASCVCAPARAALLTGRYPHRTGVVSLNMNRFPALTRLRTDEVTIADVLSDHGYHTGLIGKWHCGTGEDHHPLQRGFQEFVGFSGSQDLSYFDYVLDDNGATRHVTDEYLTEDLSRRAIEFVRRNQDRPFFLHLAHYAPHRPLEAPEELIQHYRDTGLDESTATIYAMIEVMDRGIGGLLDELTALELDRRTVIIFASDNGPDPITGSRFNLDLRGTKYEVYEGGIRVPLFIRLPGRFPSGERNHIVHFIDLFPTILDICEIEHSSDNKLDGSSFLSVLQKKPRSDRRSLYWQWNRGEPNFTHNAAMRWGPWKVVRPFVTRKVNPADSTATPVLYNLDDDPFEQHDLAMEEPERFRLMQQSLEQWCQDVERDRLRSQRTSDQ